VTPLALIALPLWLPLLATAPPHGSTHAATRLIDAACDAADTYGNAHKDQRRVFADLSAAVLPRTGEGKWRELKSEAELETAVTTAKDKSAPNNQALAWRAPDGTVFASVTFKSASGDWAHLVDYCYRADGSLSKMDATFNAFEVGENGVSRDRVQYFDAAGGVLKTTTHVRDLETKAVYRGGDFVDAEDPSYPTLGALPFAALLKWATSPAR
jgi:hypothetical protein